MVGVPGRSKGCNTCIQRKIRCDQKTPLCGNCCKSNRLCTGYKRRLGYVLSRDVSLADPTEPTGSLKEAAVTYQGRWRKTKPGKPQQAPLATYRAAEPPSVSLSRHVSASAALRQQLHDIFLNYGLPAELLDRTGSKPVIARSWLLQLQELVIQSPALQTSITAFFAAQVARKNNDINLFHQSRSMYVNGLQLFQHALRNPKTRLSDETLAACMALGLYELLEYPSGTQSAYITHRRGAMTLLQLRGPHASTSPLGQSLFLGLRTQMSAMIGNSQHRGEIFLSRPEWIERPWKLVSKTPLDELTDLLFEYQVILQQVNDLPQGASQIVLCHIFRDAIAKSLKVESAMRAVYKNFEQSVSGMLYWPDFSTLESPLDDDTQLGKLFPISFHFPVFFVAQVVTMYWSGMVAVHFLLMYTYAKIPALESIETSPSTLEDPLRPTSAGMRSFEHSKEWLSMGRNICQSVEYFLQDKLGVAGLVGILAHLRGYKSCLDNFGDERSREIAWIAERIERIQKKFDFPVNDIFGD